MAFIKKYIEQATISRRNFLLSGAAGVAATGLIRPGIARAADNPAMAWSYRNRTNPYWNSVVSGGEAFVKSLGMPVDALTHLISDGSSEKSLADVKALLSKEGGNVALAIDANDAPNARPVVEAVAKAGGFVTTMWNKTDDLHPWDFGDNYVAHLSWSSVAPAERMARTMFEGMGGKGRIVGLGGIASNVPAIERHQGLLNALKDFPDIELLDYQAADWDTQKANEVMSGFLTRFGEVDGVFCANDSMAFGAIEALRADGLAGEIPVSGYDGTPQGVELVMKGEMSGTVSASPFWGGGILAALAYHAAIGTFKPSEEPHEHREFYGPSVDVTAANVAEFKANNIDKDPEYDWNDFWGPTVGQIQY